MGRTEKTTKNIIWSVVGRMITLFASFLLQTVLVRTLGKTYLGINGLYSEILGLLSFAELGFGSAMNFSLYKPVANNDTDRIHTLLKFFKTVYHIIAATVIVIGLALLPFLQDLVKGADAVTLRELRIYYVLFLLNSVSTYFLSYKTAYVSAAQKNYLFSNYETILKIITAVFEVAVLVFFREYLFYLILQVSISIVSKVVFSQYLNRRFDIFSYRSNKRICKEDKHSILSEVKALIVHQFSSVAIFSTDYVIMSAFPHIGVVVVGLVSNYRLITNSILGIVQLIFTNISFSFGNLSASEDKRQMRKVFDQMELLGFWLYGVSAVCFYVLIPPLITLWHGSDFLIDRYSFLLIVLNGYIVGKTNVYHNARITVGHFQKDQWMAFSQAVINLAVSIVAAKYLGLIGIYLGTIISRVFYAIGRPMLTYRFVFDHSVWAYYKKNALHLALVLIIGALTKGVCSFILTDVTLLRFIAAAAVCAVLSNLLFLTSVCKTEEFASLSARFKSLLKKLKRTA